MRKLTLTIFFMGLLVYSYAQETSPSIRISGVVIDADSLEPVSFTAITIKNSTRGTVSDNSGYFSIFAYELDTLVFSNVGYSQSTFVVPPNLPKENYGLVQVMTTDTLLLEEVVVYPWPRLEDFESAFLATEPTNNLKTKSFEAKRRIQQALDTQLSREKYYYNQMRYSRLYDLTGEIPPNNFLNPITWSNFIRDWREGAYDTE